MKYAVAEFSKQGGRRSNQDRVAVAERETAVMMVLADGLGGHKGGEIAAQIMTQWAIRAFQGIRQTTISQPSAFLALTILQAHKQIRAYGKAQDPEIEPRTTCVLCLVQHGYAYWAHVGDSRLYHFRDNRLLTRTVDHSAIEKLHQEGVISAEEMQDHPQKNAITKCVGSPRNPSISLGEETLLHNSDKLLLCSDGVWEAFEPDEIARYLRHPYVDVGITEMLHDAENKMQEQCDNISAICFRWDDATSTQPALQDKLAPTVDQKTLWERAKKKTIKEKIKQQKTKVEAAKKTAATKPDKELPKKKKRIDNKIEELEDYLSQYHRKGD